MSNSNKNLPATGSGAMFNSLAPRYDLLNRLMSFGVDKRWRKRTARALQLKEGDRVLDLATGTGDLALHIAKHYPVDVVGVDPSVGMLEVGRKKITKAGLDKQITMKEGIGEEIPFPDNHFNAVTIAFGIRNCTDRPQAIREMKRVTQAGGRIGILELGEPRKGFMAPLARFHIHHIIPRLGAWLSGVREYRYLQESIEAFPPSEEFAQTISECGLHMLQVIPFSFGSCHLYLAEVPSTSEEPTPESDLAN